MVSIFNITMISPDVARLGAFWAAASDLEVTAEPSDLVRWHRPRFRGVRRAVRMWSWCSRPEQR